MDEAPAGAPAGQARTSRSLRCVLGAAAAAAALVTTSCAAGQHAQTALEHPTPQDFAFGHVGSLDVRNVAMQAPDHVSPGATSYPTGSAVPLTVVIVNSGARKDTLRNVSSPAFTGWGVYPTTSIVPAGSSSSATPASPSPAPSSTSPALGAPSARSVTISPAESVRLGVVNLTGSDTRSGADTSAETIVMTGLHGKYAPLYPSMVAPITFTFARSGTLTLKVPVQLTAPYGGVTIPTLETQARGD